MTRTHLTLVSILLGALLLSGCYSHTYRTGLRPARSDADHQAWQHHVIAGLVTISGDLQLSQICPEGTAVIHNRMTFLNALVGGITSGIYTPTTVKVWCAAPGAQSVMHEIEVDLTPELLDEARKLVPDLDEQIMALYWANSSRVADAKSTVTF